MARWLLALAVLAVGLGYGLAVGLSSRPAAQTRTIRTTTVKLISQGKSAEEVKAEGVPKPPHDP